MDFRELTATCRPKKKRLAGILHPFRPPRKAVDEGNEGGARISNGNGTGACQDSISRKFQVKPLSFELQSTKLEVGSCKSFAFSRWCCVS